MVHHSNFKTVENGYEIQFKSDGIAHSNIFSCAGTYYLGYDNILKVDFDCVAKENTPFLFISKVSFFEENENKMVMEDPNSDEPYILVFKRIK